MTIARPFRMPPTILFGEKAAAAAGQTALRLGLKKPLIVTDGLIASSGILDLIAAALKSAGLEAAIFAGVDSEPTLAHVEQGLKLLQRESCDALVGLGGGSSIDAAKAIAAMAANPGKIQDYMGLDKMAKPTLPLVAIPTTAGTGSEATIFTIITDTENDVKMLIGSPHLMPAAALVDPLLTVTMPRELTAATGLDALTHAIEAYVSIKAQPLSDLMALAAVERISAYLPQAWSNPNNLEARTQTMLGALQAGIAFSNASVGLVHGMSRPLGANFHVAHGVSNAALLGVVMEFSIIGAPERYADIAAAMGLNLAGLTSFESAKAGAEAVKELIWLLGVPTLSQLGVTQDRLKPVAKKMAHDAIASGSPANNPRQATIEEIIALYYSAL